MGPDYKPIEDYGIIGDLNTVALIAKDGSLDFLCLPDFDSPSIFAALLDRHKGGRLSLSPVLKECQHKQLYLPDTNILLTRFLSEEALVELIDFMPIGQDQRDPVVVRTLRVIEGKARFQLACLPRFHYGDSPHGVTQVNEHHLEFHSKNVSDPRLHLIGSVPLALDGQDGVAEFFLEQGQSASFLLVCGDYHEQQLAPSPEFVQKQFEETAEFWRKWIAQSTYAGRWREVVNRSALALKLLTSRKYGSIVAAPTFGLPERAGGERNWDYRYTWIRDAAFTIDAFLRLGFWREAHAFGLWLDGILAQRSPSDSKPLQIMYRLNGEKDLDETSLESWEGYRKSKPVRVGNGASKQFQLDIYGELMSALYIADRDRNAISHDGWERICQLIGWIRQNWMCADQGIWEVRGGPQEFLHSRVMCWVAVDRALRLAELRSLPAPSAEWEQLRSQIYTDVFSKFWNAEAKAFVAAAGGDWMDASMLLMPLMRFIGPTDPRWLSTLKKIEADLVKDTFVYRYDTAANADGLSGSEGAFTACSFWYIECLARSQQLERARLLFEKTISYANHLGLYSEELGRSGEHLGNFPQAFTHLSLISAALYLNQALETQGPGRTKGS